MRRGDEILPVPTFPIFRGQNNKKQQRNIFVALVASQRAREDGAFLNLAFLSDWFTFFIIFFFLSHFFKSKSGNGSVTIFRGRAARLPESRPDRASFYQLFHTLMIFWSTWDFSDRDFALGKRERDSNLALSERWNMFSSFLPRVKKSSRWHTPKS